MANRNTLHVSEINDFRDWLEADGWVILPCKGYYEVLRAIEGFGVVRAFLKDEKRLTETTNRKEKL